MFDGTKILMLPWICDENREESLHAIKTSSAQIVMGHLELQGYEMFKGHKSTHGDDPKLFDRFDCVFSGHFHTKSNSGNIFYLGSPSQYTWSDYGDERGFHIFDTETRELEFFRNRSSVFRKVFYNDTESDLENIVNFDPQEYAGCFVKIIVQNKTNPYWFDMFIDKIEKAGVSNLQVVEDHLNLNITEDEDLVNEAEDTLTILKKYVGGMTINDKKRVDSVVTSLYNEALSIG
jgi:DNA repair exonuclease SbcCD nuclease subunit